jgi:hypothetical protein
VRLWAVTVLLLGACGDGGEQALDDAAHDRAGLVVTAWAGGANLWIDDVARCSTAGGTMTVDGATLSESHQGQPFQVPPPVGQHPFGCLFITCVALCNPPSWQFTRTNDDPAVSNIQLVAGSSHWEMTVEHLFTEPSVARSTESPNEFFVTPATDVPTGTSMAVTFPDGGFVNVVTSYDAGTLTVLTPLPPGPLQISPTYFKPAVTSCVGPAFCRYDPPAFAAVASAP